MYLSKGETVYITPKQASELAKALNQCAKDCKSTKHINSNFKTKQFTLEDTGYNGTNFKINRGE